MVSNRCKTAVKEELRKLGLHFIVVDLGEGRDHGKYFCGTT
jgi:hypothetical protein